MTFITAEKAFMSPGLIRPCQATVAPMPACARAERRLPEVPGVCGGICGGGGDAGGEGEDGRGAAALGTTRGQHGVATVVSISHRQGLSSENSSEDYSYT